MKILLIEPYFTGSHKNWAKGLRKYSSHQIELFTLPGQFWKWRMHGGAVTLARMFMESELQPDLILTTDMLDLTIFLSLTRSRTANIPTAVYFHENQLSYPWSTTDRDVGEKRNVHYGFINYTTALTADHVFFNSQYHMNSFLTEARKMLKHFPDHNELETLKIITGKSSVLHLGLDLSRFDEHRSEKDCGTPLLLWNHRWEYDKNPEDFFNVLKILSEKGLDFEVAILGENFKHKPDVFDQAIESLGKKVIHYGYADSFKEYAKWLWRADILPVTSNQDFFGASIMEAVYCGTHPLLPERLSYPELIPAEFHGSILYDDYNDFVQKLEKMIQANNNDKAHIRNISLRFNWAEIINRYDEAFEEIIQLG